MWLRDAPVSVLAGPASPSARSSSSLRPRPGPRSSPSLGREFGRGGRSASRSAATTYRASSVQRVGLRTGPRLRSRHGLTTLTALRRAGWPLPTRAGRSPTRSTIGCAGLGVGAGPVGLEGAQRVIRFYVAQTLGSLVDAYPHTPAPGGRAADVVARSRGLPSSPRRRPRQPRSGSAGLRRLSAIAISVTASSPG